MRRLAVLAALVALGVATPTAAAATAPDYLARSLDARGCAREPGGIASANLTAWVVLALAASGRDTSRPVRCVLDHIRHLQRLTDIEMAALALAAAGRDPRAASGHDLVAVIAGRLRAGRIGTTVASNQFGILALRAARAPVPRTAVRTLLRDQRRDGAWAVARGGGADSNLTASGIQAAVAAGVARTSSVVTRALGALRRARAGGGYAVAAGAPADAQSTAWVLQGLAAAGRPDALARRWLLGLQRRDGAFAYRPGVAITPVWVTAQVALGYAGRPFPLVP